MVDKTERIQALANGAADAYLLSQNFYDLSIEAASDAFSAAQSDSHERSELKLTEHDRRAFVYAFLKGMIYALERECDQLPTRLPLGD